MSPRIMLAAWVCSMILGIVVTFYQRGVIKRLELDNELLAMLLAKAHTPVSLPTPVFEKPPAHTPESIRALLLSAKPLPPRNGSVPRAGGYLAPLRKDPSEPHPDNTCWSPRTYDPPDENPDRGCEDA